MRFQNVTFRKRKRKAINKVQTYLMQFLKAIGKDRL
jgi:hypothetical protein